MNNDFLTEKHNKQKYAARLMLGKCSRLQQRVGVIVKTSLEKQAVGCVRASRVEGSRQMMCECDTAACTA